MNKGKNDGGWFLGVFASVWTVGSAVLLGAAVLGIYRQLDALRFPSVQGTVVGAEVEVEADSEGGASYSPLITYSYAVGGIRYEESRFSFGHGPSGLQRSRDIVGEHPVGSQITVYYDPANPTRALLRPGVWGGDLMMLHFSIPFAVVGGGLCWAIISCWVRKKSSLPRGVEVTPLASGVRVRLPRISMVGAGLIALLVVSFLSGFVVGVKGATRAREGIAFLVMAVVSLAVGVFQKKRIASGRYDLVLNEQRQEVTLPPSVTPGKAVVIGYSQVLGVQGFVEPPKDSDSSEIYFTTLDYRAGTEERVVKLAQLDDWEDATKFADWLRGRLLLEPPIPA